MQLNLPRWLAAGTPRSFSHFSICLSSCLFVYSFNGRRRRISSARSDARLVPHAFADDAIWESVLNSLMVAVCRLAIALASAFPPRWRLIALNFPAKRCFAAWFCFH